MTQGLSIVFETKSKIFFSLSKIPFYPKTQPFAFPLNLCYTFLAMELFSLAPYYGKRVCTALSGGADSVCLLHYLYSHAAQFDLSLSAVHVEHGIRGEESLRDLKFCEDLCKSWNIPLEIVSADIPALARKFSQSEEEAGRTFRYEVFLSILQENRADFVATAHHLGDVAETVLFRLARGTSLAGMRAVTQRQGIIRPLLQTTRTEIQAYLSEHRLPHVEDSTNSDETYSRNYIRHSILPAFEKISGHATEHLVRFASLAAEDDEYLQTLAKREVTMKQGDHYVPVNLPKPLFTRACLWAMKCLGVQKDYTGAHLSELAALQTLQSGKKINLPGGAEAVREYENIVFYRPEPPFAERPFVKTDLIARDGLKADLDCFPEGCVLRTRREGDFIIPYGGRKKSLKKFLTDKKISARLGKKLPLIAYGSEILAVVGVEISDKVKITDKTVHIGYLG